MAPPDHLSDDLVSTVIWQMTHLTEMSHLMTHVGRQAQLSSAADTVSSAELSSSASRWLFDRAELCLGALIIYLSAPRLSTFGKVST